jgi:hypothetical protein
MLDVEESVGARTGRGSKQETVMFVLVVNEREHELRISSE